MLSPHGLENLRDKNAHRRLGFADDEVKDWLSAAGLAQDSVKKLSGDPLTVTLWSAAKPGVPQGSGRPSRRQPVEVA
ncbi:MAG: hypothetical protein QGF09_12465 [Rhodospirillales bacterium]|nr:hypothetical protein [Rhodospirillales bacterium]